MKVCVTFKDPDALHNAVREAVAADISEMDLDDDERDLLSERREEKVRDLCKRWLKWGEYLTVEIDTVEGTCRVVEAAR